MSMVEPPPRKRRRSGDGVVSMTSGSSSEVGATTADAGTCGAAVDMDTSMAEGGGVGASGNTRRVSGGGFLSSRESALVLAGETLTLACTHWLMEESYRDAEDRAVGALRYAAQLLTCPGRTNAGLLDSVHRSLRAAIPMNTDICYEWTRYNYDIDADNNSNNNMKKNNYGTWDPEMSAHEWAAEKVVLFRIKNAIEHAIVNCEVTIYASLATVIDKIAQASAQRVEQI